MISCTEFIPCYSELFTYLEEKNGRDEVSRFWDYLFKPTGDGIPLINFVKKEGIRGCFSYWKGTLNEEAADFTMYLNEKRGFFMNVMHKCPSKGRLLQLKDDIGITPYHDYCLHCDSYRYAVEKVGLKYIYNFNGIDHAACSMLIYDPKVFDGRVIIDEDTEIMDRKASDNEYFHRDFHSSMNMGIHYVGENYGLECVKEFLERYTKNVYAPVFKDMEKNGLKAIESKILDTYKKEHSEDAVTTELNGDTLTVNVSYCPGVKHLKATGRVVSPWYRYTTEVVMDTLAKAGGFTFVMDSYDEETGAAKYHFTK
ncbi:MAG: hypothetical protein Q4B67_01120 [Eubacteriales bacterium]|nr:hypothetical protein [Eubacteriales bacterium]